MGVIFALYKNDKILLQQRDEYCSKFPLRWCFPGGTSEDGELPIETLLREVDEEYGIKLNSNQCYFLTHFFNNIEASDLNFVYFCKLEQNQNPEMKEGEAMAWYSLDEIQNIELGFDQKDLIQILQEYLLLHHSK